MTTTRILCIGVNHETAPLAMRETLACMSPVTDPGLGHACPHIDEWVIVSTCNRVEIYVATSTTLPLDNARELLLTHFGASGSDLLPYVYVYEDEAAIDHLLRVAAGLDSLVLGEPQILGQVSRAFTQAQEQHTAGPVMRALFRTALAAGKRVRSETAIGQNPASVPSVAINQARLLLGSLRERTLLLVGAGAMAQTAIKALRAREYSNIRIANRTFSRAEALVEPWGGTAYELGDLSSAVAAADVVFCATDSQVPLLTADLVRGAMAGRTERPLLLFDLSVPRNIDPAAVLVDGVTLVDMDRLHADLDESLTARQAEVPAVEAILAGESAALQQRLAELAMRPVIADLRQKAEQIRRRELERALRNLGDVDEQTLAQLQHLSRALVNQLLHEPTRRLRQEATGERHQAVAEVVRALFNLTPSQSSDAANGDGYSPS